MSNWDYIIEKLSPIRSAKTIRLSDMKTDEESWLLDDLCNEVNELREKNAHLENTITDLKAKLDNAKDAEEPHWLASSSTNDIAFAIERKAREEALKEKEMNNENWKRVNYYAEHQTGSLPDDIGYIEIMIKGGSDEQTEKIIVDLLPEFYADIWGQNPDKIYRIVNKTAIPKLDIENMQEVWPKKAADEIVVDYGDTSIKQLCKQIDKLVQENKNLSERISFLNAELSLLQDELESSYAYSDQVEKLVPKKKLKKFWKEQRKS